MTLDTDIEERIRDAPLSAHLATSVGDRPHVAPVWYGYRDGALYTITGGKKLENARRNPRVAVSIEEGDGEGGVDWGVTLLGHVTVIDDPDRIAEAEAWVYDAYDQHETDGGEEEEFDPGDPGVDYALLKINIGSASLSVYE
jgi:nitroimidazol reductase NimA-like FMN-containing flavoprotein (pyridoxamine 5'-phosphate oxidase superfamily)